MSDSRPADLLTLALSTPSETARMVALGPVFAPSVDPRLVVCDPTRIDTARPLIRTVPAASHWAVSVLELPTGHAWGVAAALVVLEGPEAALPATWERALFDGGGDRYPVDFGCSAITDAAAIRHLRRDRALRESVLARIEGPAGCDFFDAGEACCDLAWFQCGTGEGQYRAWWGLDRGGQPVWLLVDYELDH